MTIAYGLKPRGFCSSTGQRRTSFSIGALSGHKSRAKCKDSCGSWIGERFDLWRRQFLSLGWLVLRKILVRLGRALSKVMNRFYR